jgi:SAM-dependent methyltransferase
MDDAAIKKYVDRYEEAYRKHGYSLQGLCSSAVDRSDLRFSVLTQPLLELGESVLDVGCGFADLFRYLKKEGWKGRYTGIDIVPSLLKEAGVRHPDAQLIQGDASRGLADVGPHDFVIACGAMNLKLPNGGNEAHIASFLRAMFKVARLGVVADFMTTHVDFRHPDAWHTDPIWALEQAQRLTRRVTLRADYLPFEFALFLFKDVSTLGSNMYRAFPAGGNRSDAGS